MKPNHEEHGGHGEKRGKALWKKGSARLLTKFIPVLPVVPVVLLLNPRLGLSKRLAL